MRKTETPPREPAPRRTLRAWALRYAAALAVASVAVAATDQLEPVVGPVAFFIPIALVATLALFVGTGGALVCSALIVAGLGYFVFDPRYDPRVSDPRAFYLLAGFLLVALLTAAIAGAQRRSRALLGRQMAALRESEERFRIVTEAMPQLVWIMRPDGELEYLNRRWSEYTGTTLEHCRADGWSRVIHPEDAQQTLERWRHSLATGEPYDMEYRLRRARDGAYHWFLGRALPLRDEDGRIVRWFGTCTDIHDQKQAHAELADAKERLEDADQRKNHFLAMLSHELRNPLAPIRNSVYILERSPADGEQARRARQVIERQTLQMTRLIDDLLDVTRIARGKINLQLERFDLNALAGGTAEDHRELFARSGVDLAVIDAGRPLYVDGDPTRMAQVVGNLLNNSAKFTPRGGHTTLTIGASGDGNVALRVSDDGTGIAPSTLEHMFEPFVQADRTLDRTRGGLGLGLALVKGLVEMHGGTVSARSEGFGKGAEFTVTLPMKATLAPRPPATTPQERATGGRRVLVIEDNTDAAETLRQALEFGQHVVAVAYSGPEGVEAARRFKPDVVLCDIGLPGMDGYGVAQAIRADASLRPTYLVALSGYALPEDIRRSREVGFDRHIAKPPNLVELGDLLATAPVHASDA